MDNFGNNLRLARKSRGLSQETLALQVNVARSTLSNWEKGRREPNLDALFQLSSTLDISLDALFESHNYLKKDPQLNRVNSLFNQLNEEGQDMILAQLQMMSESNRYIKNHKLKLGQKEVG